MSLPEPFSTERFVPGCFEASGSVRIAGKPLAFRTVSEDFVFYAPDGTPEASLFAISYLAKDAGENRPVMFLWNGGRVPPRPRFTWSASAPG